MVLLDPLKKIISLLSPQHSSRGTSRFRAQYDAAAGGRRLGLWMPGSLGPNATVTRDLDRLRARSRDATRNNSWVKRGIENWVANEVACGIEPKAASSSKAFNEAADELWEKWACGLMGDGRTVADADGILDFYGLLALAARSRVEAGEVFIRLRTRTLADGLPVPLQVQLLEAEFCPVSENNFKTGNGAIRAGIEFNGIGKRTAYWMYPSHPGELEFGGRELVRVPAQTVIHHFAPLRPGQIRGVPWTVQALIKSKDFDEYDDAELVRKKGRASYTGVIRRPTWTEEDFKFDPMSGEAIEKDANNVGIIETQAGSFPALLPGEDVTLFDGDPSGNGYKDFVRQQLLGVFAALNVPYEFGSGDFSGINDRVLRVILSEFHRIVEQSQWHYDVPQICRPVWETFIDLAVLSGALQAADYQTNRADFVKVTFHPQGWPYLHELQDTQSAVLKIEKGLSSRKREAAARGEVIEEIDKENAEDRERAADLGLDYSATSDQPAATEEPPPADAQS